MRNDASAYLNTRVSLFSSRLWQAEDFSTLIASADDQVAVTLGELLRRLEAGPYADIVRPARRAFAESHDPFLLDAALDRSYYEGLENRAQPVEK